MVEGTVVLEAADKLFYKQIWGCLETTMLNRSFV